MKNEASPEPTNDSVHSTKSGPLKETHFLPSQTTYKTNRNIANINIKKYRAPQEINSFNKGTLALTYILRPRFNLPFQVIYTKEKAYLCSTSLSKLNISQGGFSSIFLSKENRLSTTRSRWARWSFSYTPNYLSRYGFLVRAQVYQSHTAYELVEAVNKLEIIYLSQDLGPRKSLNTRSFLNN